MREILSVTKMHGLGNSYVIISDLDGRMESEYSRLAQAVSNKSYGVGSDGMLVAQRGAEAPNRMRVFNPDGSEAEMCGNGIRQLALFLYDNRLAPTDMNIETKAGVKRVVVYPGRKDGTPVRVDIGKGEITGYFSGSSCLDLSKYLPASALPKGYELAIPGRTVSVGNPHFVHFTTKKAAEEGVKLLGPIIENHPQFQPGRINVEFAHVDDEHTIDMYVWERGAGLTQACGTGACATAYAAKKQGDVKNPIKVRMPGGDLLIEVSDNDDITMTGTVEYIFKGKLLGVSGMLKHFA